ncbi:MAG: ribonuclease III domain-containing protein, partial [Myxococcota bacterium]
MSHPLEDRLGYQFAEPSMLAQALTHSTYANEHPEQGEHNERLEFLGDAVVGLLTADMLFDRLGEAHEGQLTKRRARVVRREGLAEIARSIDLGEYLKLGEGQRRAGGHYSDRILADAMEALAAALYRDGGMEA